MASAEVYVSTDIETDGPIPGPNSMLSLGSVAFLADGTEVGSFSVNLVQLFGATPDPSTMTEFWVKHPEAWAACRKDPEMPELAMPRYVAWLKGLGHTPVFVGYPAGFDFLFVYWYLRRFAGESPFSFSALDIKSFAMAVLGTDYRYTTKRNMPKRWFPETKHTHIAVEDAREQGLLFLNILRESRQKRS
jgi:hypothetical protein